jgi:solute carrier family 25 (mitochondrial phosphate transporter), member 23/24/25/41
MKSGSKPTAPIDGQTHMESLKFASISLALPPGKSQRTSRTSHACHRSTSMPVFELGAATSTPARLTPIELAARRPIALLALVPRPLVLFTAGALSGAIAKTITAPLDRVKILLQVRGGLESGAIAAAAARGNLVQSLIAVGRQEGIAGYWKGNLPQVLRVVPYSAAQLYSYEVFKHWFVDNDGNLSVQRRLAAGAAAGMTATLLTHPLDTLRLRLAVDPNCPTLMSAVRALAREGGVPAFYRGLAASMAGIAPYMALELASYDLLPKEMPSFARGFTAAFIATFTCYPLDTVRRQIQLEATRAVPWQAAAVKILNADGIKGFYRGFLPNAIKNLPNKGVKLTVFDSAKKALTAGEIAYGEECAAEGLSLAKA